MFVGELGNAVAQAIAYKYNEWQECQVFMVLRVGFFFFDGR